MKDMGSLIQKYPIFGFCSYLEIATLVTQNFWMKRSLVFPAWKGMWLWPLHPMALDERCGVPFHYLSHVGFLDGGGEQAQLLFLFQDSCSQHALLFPPSTQAWCSVPSRFYRKNKQNRTKPNWNRMQTHINIHTNNVPLRTEEIEHFRFEKSNQLQVGNQAFPQYQVPQLLYHEEPLVS